MSTHQSAQRLCTFGDLPLTGVLLEREPLISIRNQPLWYQPAWRPPYFSTRASSWDLLGWSSPEICFYFLATSAMPRCNWPVWRRDGLTTVSSRKKKTNNRLQQCQPSLSNERGLYWYALYFPVMSPMLIADMAYPYILIIIKTATSPLKVNLMKLLTTNYIKNLLFVNFFSRFVFYLNFFGSRIQFDIVMKSKK